MQSCCIPGHMFAHFPDYHIFRFVLCHKCGMFFYHILNLCKGRSCRYHITVDCRFNFPEKPWVTFCPTANCDSVASCIMKHLQGIFCRKYITVAKNRYLYFILDRCDYIPVCFAGIKLFPRSSVNRNGCRPGFLHYVGELHRIYMFIVKTFSELHCNGFCNFFNHCIDYFTCQRGIFH